MCVCVRVFVCMFSCLFVVWVWVVRLLAYLICGCACGLCVSCACSFVRLFVCV